MLGQTKVKKLCDQILSRCGANPAEVLLFSNDSALTRFANNTIHQNVSETDIELLVRVLSGQRIGTASTNRTDPAALDEIVTRARANAEASPEDPDYPGLPEPVALQHIEAFDPATAEMSPEARAHAVGVICRLAAEKKLNSSGAFSTGYNEIAVANSRGVSAYHITSSVDFQTVIMSDDSSGRAHASGWRVADISIEAIGREAIEKTERGRNPRKIEPGKFTIVLDAYGTEDLVGMLGFTGMGASSVLEGRSWMNDRIGQKVMSSAVSIWDDGLDPLGMPLPFDFEGMPKQRVDIVKAGVVLGPVYDRYTGKKAGKPSTGHALPPTLRGFGPLPMNLFMAPGSATLDEMIRSTEKGLYITRFWYTRVVHPRDCVITGMTRDGVFLIENGKLAYPVKNLRFTQAYVEALANVEAVGCVTHLIGSEYGGGGVRVPALRIKDFNFTGSTA